MKLVDYKPKEQHQQELKVKRIEKILTGTAKFEPLEARLELSFKFNELPPVKEVENGWKQFKLRSSGLNFSVTVRPKVWNKLVKAASEYPLWVAALTAKLGEKTSDGFNLEQPGIQVYEKKAKSENTDS